MVNNAGVEHNKTIQVDQGLSDEILHITKKVEDHLGDLESIISDGKKDVDIDKKQKKLVEEVSVVLGKVDNEMHLTDTARIALHRLHEHIEISEETLGNAVKESEKKMSIIGKIASGLDKNAGVIGIGVGAGKGLWSGMSNVRKGKGFWKKSRGAIKGLVSGGIWGGITYGVSKLLSILGIEREKLLEKVNPLLHPVKAMKEGVMSIKNKIASVFSGSGEQYDPKNQGVFESLNDSDVFREGLEGPEIILHDENSVKFAWKGGHQEVVGIHGSLESFQTKEQIEGLYGLGTKQGQAIADKSWLYLKAVNMRTQAARKKGKDSLMSSIHLREQELVAFQELLKEKKPINDIESFIATSMQKIANNEGGAIGNSRYDDSRKNVKNYIQEYKVGTKRDEHFEAVEYKVYNEFRGIVAHGDSDVVKEMLYNDLEITKKYQGIDEVFQGKQGEELFDNLSRIQKMSKNDQWLTTFITDHLKKHGRLHDEDGLKESQVSGLVKIIISVYHQTKETINQNLHEYKKYFNRSYGWELDTDTRQQQKMIDSYEAMYGKKILEDYAHERGLSYEQNTWKVVYDFAWDQIKQNSLRASVALGFKDAFYDVYLPTQARIETTYRESISKMDDGVISVTKTVYSNKKEGLLADIIGAGSDVADSTISTAISAGTTVALSLIPVVGVEFAVGRLAAGMITRGLISAGTRGGRAAVMAMRGVVGHTVMAGYETYLHDGSMKEFFSNLSDWKGLAQNAVFFNVMGRMGPWLKGNFGQIAKSSTVARSGLQSVASQRCKQGLGRGFAYGSEAMAIEASKSLFDAQYEWNRGEVMQVMMLSSILSSKLGPKALHYKAVKNTSGKISLQPNKIVFNKVINKKTVPKAINSMASKLTVPKFYGKQTLGDLFEKGSVTKQEFMSRAKTHDIKRTEKMLVGDLFKNLGVGNIKKILFDGLKTKGLNSNQSILPTRTLRRMVWAGKNFNTLFTYGSIVQGGVVGDDGDAGRDEAAENYILYGVLGRGIFGKILLGTLDFNNVII